MAITDRDISALDRQNLSADELAVTERLLSEYQYDRSVDAVQDARAELAER